jgi:hypothetical protein
MKLAEDCTLASFQQNRLQCEHILPIHLSRNGPACISDGDNPPNNINHRAPVAKGPKHGP